MDKAKPYLSFSSPFLGVGAILTKKAAEKNAKLMRARTVEEHRAAIDVLAEVRLVAPGTRMREETCATVPCEWIYRDNSATDKVILYLHGGSWAYGNLRTARPVGVLLSAVSGYRVLVAEYRLSPEHPFPAGLDDCTRVYDWLLKNGFSPENIGIFGDSAGGNLALALLHRLRAAGEALPVAVGLASPATDLSERSELARRKPDLLFTQYEGEEKNIFSLYYRDQDREDPLLSPIYGDLSGFPPMLIHVGQDEDLVIDNDLFAQKAYNAGVDVALKIWRGMYHDFTIVGLTLRESRQSLQEFGAFFKKHLGGAEAIAAE